MNSVLITGGLGFIGSHTVDLLVEKGYRVRILDNLEPQVHGEAKKPPEYANKKADLIIGDIRDQRTLDKALRGVDAVLHLAAAVGVGQSMYQIEKYASYNTYGAAALLDTLVNKEHSVKKLVVASSMSIYGEGKYFCSKCGPVYPSLRGEEQLRRGEWEPKCPHCGKELKSVPTDEEKPLASTSIYAQTKRHQEEMSILIGRTYGLPTVALRYFNVYGPRQTISNPYTGVSAIFMGRIINRNPPYIFEDGRQTRDFVNVRDVARANLLALERSGADYNAINIGSGKPLPIAKMAELLIEINEADLKPSISYRYRKGDIRHCYADISKARKLLGYGPEVNLKKGLTELVEWGRKEKVGEDKFDLAMKELEKRKLA